MHYVSATYYILTVQSMALDDVFTTYDDDYLTIDYKKTATKKPVQALAFCWKRERRLHALLEFASTSINFNLVAYFHEISNVNFAAASDSRRLHHFT